MFPLFGIALIVAALLQFGLWTGRGLRLRRQEKKKFDAELERLRAEIYQITRRTSNPTATDEPGPSISKPASPQTTEPLFVSPDGNWKGYRQFRVARLVQESESCKSVYLSPVDGKTVIDFRPGQHLTLRFSIPGQAKPVVRCYSLSDAPDPSGYRISVKRCMPAPETPSAPPGMVSNFINSDLQEGNLIDVKSPSGTFYMQPGSNALVLLAGGVGITPMLSMLNTVAQSNLKRECLLVYGVGNSQDHAFRKHLQELSRKHPNIHVITCYCNPLPTDQLNHDYQVRGYVTVDLLRQLLPNNNYDFYLCGPPPFMQSLYDGLGTWGVNEESIRYEAFGPASIKKSSQTPKPAGKAAIDVRFSQSGTTVTWSDQHENLLEFMEAQDIPIESGCRAGSCGTCETRLLKGQVRYEDESQIECEDGCCLPCVAKPAEAIEIDA